MEPVAQFYLPCGLFSDLYYAVEFYEHQSAMVDAITKLRGRRSEDDLDARAMCLRYVAEARGPSGRLRRTGELGTIFFVKGDAGPEVVVHELTHAAIGWANRAKVNPTKHNNRATSGEEKFATTLQFMFEQFYEKAPAALAAAA
jgi:hypothetical protein